MYARRLEGGCFVLISGASVGGLNDARFRDAGGLIQMRRARALSVQ